MAPEEISTKPHESLLPSLWLIPARGGSKGIPGKNIKPLAGLSPVARAVNLAFECRQPDDTVFVSTDSADIATEAIKAGCEIPFMRPESLARDNSGSYEVIIHAIEEFKKRGREFSRVILLQPTSPLRNAKDVANTLALWSPGIDMAVSVCEASANPYYNLFETDPEGYLHISKGKGNITRRQDAPKVWEYNGAVYVMTVSSLLKGPMSGFRKIIPSPMPRERSLDLDTPSDWLLAEFLLNS